MPRGRTTRANTVPLARKGVPALSFMSRMVTLRRMCGRGIGAGKVALKDKSGIKGEEIKMGFGSEER